jgi:hypothetical protein
MGWLPGAQLEYISIAGFMFVLMLLFTMIVEACQAGLPAIGDGEFAVVGFTGAAQLPWLLLFC